MTWHNLPCPATLPAVSQLCPDGWLEVLVEHVSRRSTPGGGDPQEAESVPHVARAWGLDCDALASIDEIFADMYSFGDAELSKVPSGATALFKVLVRPATETSEGFLDGPPGYSLTACWGVDGAPVYTLDKHPSLTGQQPAPQPGRGDMWASVIERYDGQINPALVDIFKARREQGLAKYNTPLQADNGRDICKDIADETLDRIVYAEQAAQERPEFADIMRGMQDRDIATLGGLLGLYGRMMAQLGPEAPNVQHPIDDRPQVDTAEVRAAALVLCAAAELVRRSKKHAATHPCADMAMQVSLAENPTDLALIGKMAGRAGAAMFAVLGIGPGGERLPGGPR